LKHIKLYEQFHFENILNRDGFQFISHSTKEDWGESILIMEKEGKAFGRIYWYNDDDTTVYLDWLSVDKDARKGGLGTILQKIREDIGKELGAKFACLWVKKDSWMHDWYERRGYKDYMNYKEDKNYIWMQKTIE